MNGTGHHQAFPTPAGDYGLSKRELFAAMAMQGLLANGDISCFASQRGFNPAHVRADYARVAVDSADLLIAELAKEQP